ncbi:MAG: hypothetical protein EOM68_25590 [Spirochaetia bacterium]|nr:hypothetical protein [Spirochaetia bacterium]
MPADIDPATGTLSPESVKQKITPQTGLILNYHHLGYVGYTDELNAIGATYGIPVVEDCLDGIGALYKGRKVGTCSDAAVISHLRCENAEKIRKLISMGFVPGRRIVLENDLPFKGPIVLRIGDSRVALDRDYADLIFVDRD